MAAEALGSQWIPIRQGQDIVMMLAVANVLFKENLYNADFVSKFVEPTGFAKWKDYVLGNTAGPDGKIDRTPEWAAPICGVPADTIRSFARLYAAAKPAFLLFTWGPARSSRGVNSARGAVYLQAMTGNIGVQGGSASLSAPGLQGIPAPSPNFQSKSPTYTAPKLFATFKLYDAILLRPQLDSGKITKEQYCATIGCNINWTLPNIKMIIVLGHHSPMNQKGNYAKQILAIKAVDMFVKADRNWVDGMYADIVLPLTMDYEESGFQSTPTGFVYQQRIMQPAGEARPLEWVRVQLANLIGVGDNYNPVMKSVTWDNWDATIQTLSQQAYTTWASSDAAKNALGTAPPAWSDFLKQPVIKLPKQSTTPPYAFKDQIQAGKPFQTTSGKIEFYNPVLENFDLTKIFVKGSYAMGAPIAPMAIYETPEGSYFDNAVSTYPLVLRDSHNRYRGHTMNESNPMLRDEVYRHSLWVNVSDAKVRNIVDGDKVMVFNDIGSLIIPAYVTSRVVPGMVYMWDGAWVKRNKAGVDIGGGPNSVMADNLVSSAAGQESTNELVEVTKVS